MEALHQPTLRVAAVIAEGVQEQDTKKLIAYARKHNKIILGPATVGGMQVCSLAFRLIWKARTAALDQHRILLLNARASMTGLCVLALCELYCELQRSAGSALRLQAGAFRVGDTAGTLDNIVSCKLYRPGSVGFVSKSGGMSNEMYNVLSRTTDGLYEGEAA